MTEKQPQGELAIRTLAMPSNTNPDGHIFGGWVVSQMDLAGLSIASRYAPVRCVTVAIDSMTFLAPVHVGDFVCCYARVDKLGRTSVTVTVETWAIGTQEVERRKVTQGQFIFVSIDESGRPIPIKGEGAAPKPDEGVII